MLTAKSQTLIGLLCITLSGGMTLPHGQAAGAGRSARASSTQAQVTSVRPTPPPTPPNLENASEAQPEALSCRQPCDDDNVKQASHHMAWLKGAGKHHEAIAYLETCHQACPKLFCQLTLAYSNSNLTPHKEDISNKRLRHLASQCKDNPTYRFGLDEAYPNLTQQDRDALIEQVWRKTHRPIWAGWGLLGGGAAVTITSAILMGLAATNRLPGPGSCGSYSGVRGDPCIVDFDNPGAKAGLSIPLLLGLGGMISGAALLLTY